MTPFGRILYWLFFGSRGGESRTSILKILSKTPVNTNKLSELAELDYKTTEHHVKVLLDNGVIESVGGGYGKLLVLSERAESETELLKKIIGGNKNVNKKGK